MIQHYTEQTFHQSKVSLALLRHITVYWPKKSQMAHFSPGCANSLAL